MHFMLSRNLSGKMFTSLRDNLPETLPRNNFMGKDGDLEG